MKIKKYLSFLTGLLLISSSTEIMAQFPASVQTHPTVLQGGTIVTVAGETIKEGVVIFEKGKITYVGVNADLPEGATVVDAKNKFIYPAMIHARNALGLSEITRVTETTDLQEHGTINPNIRAQVAFNAESEHIPLARTHGIAVTVATPTGGIISGLSAAMLTDGWNWKEMTLRAPIAMVVNWPVMTNKKTRDTTLVELTKTFQLARQYMQARSAAGGEGIPNHKTNVRWEAMIPVLKGEIPVHVNANELTQIQAAINWAEKENIKMVLVGGRDAEYVLPQLKDKNIPVIVSPVIESPSRPWEGYDNSYLLPSMLYESGIEFCIAGDFNPAYIVRLTHHSASAVAFGLPQVEALKAVTLYPAKILGIDDRMGSIEVGKDASLIIADGNLLELSTTISQVYIQGREVNMFDKHQRLYDRYRKRYDSVGQ